MYVSFFYFCDEFETNDQMMSGVHESCEWLPTSKYTHFHIQTECACILCKLFITKISVAEPSNLMSPRSACLLLDTKHPKENTKLLGSVGHTPGENQKIYIFSSGSQMRE